MTLLVFTLLVFLGVGSFFLFIHLLMGKAIRPAKAEGGKHTIYECGEPTIGSAWIQFDLRFYVVALLFVIFDVEVAFFFPWAVVFGSVNALAKPDVNEADTANRQVLSAQLGAGSSESGRLEGYADHQCGDRQILGLDIVRGCPGVLRRFDGWLRVCMAPRRHRLGAQHRCRGASRAGRGIACAV